MSVLALATSVAFAAPSEFVKNGGFDYNAGNGQIGFNTTADDWSVAAGGYTFLFTSAAAAMAGTTNGSEGPLALYGPGNGVANGFTGSSQGGAFIAQDSAYKQMAITQSISGLTPGNNYVLTFEWAGAQQTGYLGQTWDEWQVSFGSQLFTTEKKDVPSQGFNAWKTETHTFTALNETEILSFFANGGPSGLPPFALLDNVSLQAEAVPEPGVIVGMLTGFAAFARRRRAAKARG
ncbi:MAG: PEP-CTERM sorting domain-containing protein [Fimbriimonas sp.]